MASSGKNWAIVLAAGEGTRLRELTSQGDVVTPKQYCSLSGGRSLLGDALARATRIVSRKRIVVVVAEEHRSLWSSDLAHLPVENIVVQPRNRGTAAGILLPLFTVLERDPEARVAVLPSDHYVEEEYVIERSMLIALESLEDLREGITLLGIVPDAPESEYGWIIPRRSPELARRVARFVEKPDLRQADELLAQGGVWNSFLFAANGTDLLELYARKRPELLARFRSVFALGPETRAARVAALYDELESSDFSRELLQGNEDCLRLEIVPPCGWTDLGTPERVEACLTSQWEKLVEVRRPWSDGPKSFDLSWAVQRLRGATGGRTTMATA